MIEENGVSLLLKTWGFRLSAFLVLLMFIIANSFMGYFLYRQYFPIKSINVIDAKILNSPIRAGDTIQLYVKQKEFVNRPADAVYVIRCERGGLYHVRTLAFYPVATDHGEDRLHEFVDETTKLPLDVEAGMCELGMSVRFDLDNNRTTSTFFSVPFEVID